MKKTIVGVVAAAAIVAPLALAASAQAVTTKSTDPDCTPVLEQEAVAEESHLEFKYVLEEGNGHIQWATESKETMEFDDVEYVAEYNKKGDHKTRTVIDVPGVDAVDGVTCVIPLPDNPLTDASVIDGFVPPSDTEKVSWSELTDHRLLNGKVGITVTAKPGYEFAYGNSTLTSKVFALDVSTPLPANPLADLTHETVETFEAPTTPGVVWSELTDNRWLNGKVGITATPEPGRVFAMPNGTYSFAAKNFAITLGSVPTA